MGEISREQENQDPSDRKDRFHERMEQLVPTFLEIRKKMGVKEEIGFGYLPEVHSEGISMGSLPEIKKTKKGDIKYEVPEGLGQTFYENLPKEEEKNILVIPVSLKHKQRIVSIHDPFEKWDTTGEFPRLIDAPDDVFVGLIAHELAHSYNFKSKFPPEVRSALENRYKDINPESKYKWRYDVNNEEDMDLIAALLGYKNQIIAKIDFMIDRINRTGPAFKGRKYTLEQLEKRKKVVLEYCP